MRLRYPLALSIILASGCAQPTREPRAAAAAAAAAATASEQFNAISFTPNPERSSAWNFQAQLDLPVFQCHLAADSGHNLYRMGIRSALEVNGAQLSQCLANSRTQGDQALAAFKSSNPPVKLLALGKDLYSKWSTYLGSMNVLYGESGGARLAYETARSAFLTEERFAK